ncbi:MAG TPA: DNA replication/repair protein RecF [Longimicrobiales bacterium]
MSVVPNSAAYTELRLRQFRNFAELELGFPTVGVAIIGDNGAGKTNLLEALYYLEIFRSFRGAPDERLVRFGTDAFFVRGRLTGPGSAGEVAVGFERRGRRKRVALNGAPPERLGDAIGSVGAVIFSPSDVALVAGSPAERRRFLDIVLSLNRPGYLGAVQRYRQALRNRNSMLRSGAQSALLAAWEPGLVQAGARVMALRAEWALGAAPGFARRYAAISPGQQARLTYVPSVPLPREVPQAAEAEEAFRQALAQTAQRERERRLTLVGPHRDDLGLLMERDGEERELRDFGSGGQQRTAAIALRMVEAESVREARGREPVILLDDVFAELDPGRSRRILDLLEAEESGQAILTAPKQSDLEVRRGALPHWRIEDGRILE